MYQKTEGSLGKSTLSGEIKRTQGASGGGAKRVGCSARRLGSFADFHGDDGASRGETSIVSG